MNSTEGDTRRYFDYIITGAGSAGCVLARRLVESTDAQILLLEAGDGNVLVDTIENPLRWLENIGSDHDYLYQYQPTPQVDNRVIYAPRGKGLGGSGNINAMVWARGHQDDYNHWAALGNGGWDYQSVLPLFKKIEDWEDGATANHGSGGPIHISRPEKFHWVDQAVIDAARSYGMPYSSDMNGPEPNGVGPMSMNIDNGVRSSPFKGYLQPVLNKKNLTVITGATVTRLIFRGTRCQGVEFIHKEQLQTAYVSEEVLLSAGAIDTPRILMLSGIGAAAELKLLGIPVITDLWGVGKNLQDHPLISVTYETKEPLGTLTYNGGGSNLYWKSQPSRSKPDLMLVPIQTGIASDEVRSQYPIPDNAFSIFVTLVDVRSRGQIRMKTATPGGPLEIQPNLLQDAKDREAMAHAVELCMDLAEQPSLRTIIRRWVAPGQRSGGEAICNFLRAACSTYFHPVGTCAMGIGKEAVVDPELKLYGIEGLRIADASIMPQITTGNTNAPTLMIGEFAASLLIKENNT